MKGQERWIANGNIYCLHDAPFGRMPGEAYRQIRSPSSFPGQLSALVMTVDSKWAGSLEPGHNLSELTHCPGERSYFST